MKIFFIFLSLLIPSISYGYEVFVSKTGEIVHTENAPVPQKNIVDNDTSFVITYTFDSLIVVKDDIFPDKVLFMLPDFGIQSIPEKAALLSRKESYRVDDCESLEISHISVETYDYNLSYSPARQPQPTNADNILTKEDILPITIEDAFYPEAAAMMADPGFYRGKRLDNIVIAPVQYNSYCSTARINRQIILEIKKEGVNQLAQENSSLEYVSEDDVILNNSVTNLNSLMKVSKPTEPDCIKADRKYLLITHPELLSVANRLADWKRTMGYTVEIKSRMDWNEDGIKTAIKKCYDESFNLYYVILIGDQNMVPPSTSRKPNKEDHFYTDIPYACLDGRDDYFPDLCIGRIPASTLSEAENAVEKIVSYEKNPSFGLDESIAVSSAYFQDSGHDGMEDAVFVYNAEMVYDYITPKFDSVKRIYYAEEDVNPLRWSKYKTPSGDSIPTYLRKPNFAWDGSKDDIISTFNNGCHFFYHLDHGNYDLWGGPRINSADFAGLKNNVYPILISIDCMCGNFLNPDNFARKLLGMKNAGCASILGFVEEAWAGYSNTLFTGMINALWPYPGISFIGQFSPERPWLNDVTYRQVSSIGEMQIEGINRMYERCSGYVGNPEHEFLMTVINMADLLHCIGDPGLSVFWDNETNLKELVSLSRDDDKYSVNISKAPCYIAYHNITTGESCRFYGYKALCPYSSQDNVEIAVYRPGCKPVFLIYADQEIGSPNDGLIESVSITNKILSIKLSKELNYTEKLELRLIYPEKDIVLTEIPVIDGCYVYNIDLKSSLPQDVGPKPIKNLYAVVLSNGKEILDTKKILY